MENINNTPVIEPLYSGDGRQLYPITHIKAIIGLEQYPELVDQSVTTKKVADGAITLDKLSPELQELLNSLKTT